VQDRLGVAGRLERVTLRDELRAQLHEVVDLAVEDDRDRAVLVEDRLVRARAIDDRESPEREPHAAALQKAVGVGTAMRHRAGHAPQQRTVDAGVGSEQHETGNAAHEARILALVDRARRGVDLLVRVDHRS
jgi:hypothetical protein